MTRKLAPLFFLLAIAVVLPSAPPRVAEAAQPAKKKGTSYAFLVACAKYNKTELQPIKDDVTINDVLEFRKALLETGFDDEHIVMMHDKQADGRYKPEHDKILEELRLFLDRKMPEDTVLVVLSGHGVLFKGDETGYFCPVDAKISTKAKLIPMDGKGGLYTQLEACKAGRKLLIANMCRNDPAASTSLAGNKIELTDDYPEKTPKGIAAIYSCAAGQKSYYDADRKRSLFFIHLTDAWRGKYQTGEGALTLESVFEHTRVKTKADADKTFAEKQYPVVRRQYEGEWPISIWPGLKEYGEAMKYGYGVGVGIDGFEAVKWARKAAEVGHPFGKVRYAAYLRGGMYLARDEKEANRLEREAFPEVSRLAKHGNTEAEFYLGRMYGDGLALGKDEAEAVKWYRKAAEQNLAMAQNNLGARYAEGRGVGKAEAEAFKWYRKAAEQNFALAQNILGWRYANGLGVGQDEVEAVKWYRKATEQNLALAQNNLGWAYSKGIGVGKDEAEAVKWYRKAADQNEAKGQINLGYMYLNGRGVEKDEAEAVKWFRKAADQGDENAKQALKRLEK